MTVVVVPADQAEMLLPQSFRLSSENYAGPHVLGRHPPAKDIVIHDQEVKPVACPACEGKGVRTDPDSVGRAFVAVLDHGKGAGVQHLRCPTCDGYGTVPSDVTLAVECGTCGGVGCDLDFCRACGEEYTDPCPRHRGCTVRCEGCCPDCQGGVRVVGTATVAECLPFATDFGPRCVGRHVEVQDEGVLLLGVQETAFRDYSTNITDRIVGTPSPRLWALTLTDVVKS